MKSIRFVLPVAALALTAISASAQATQEVSYEVAAINEITFSGTPSLVIQAATAGAAPTSASASGTYAITTNETNRKITAQLDSDMPAGTTLSVALAAPAGAASAGTVVLSTVSADVVTGISTVNAENLSVTYGLAATVAAGVVAPGSRTVTYTITAGV